MAVSPETRRAARAGHRLLKRVLPPVVSVWLEKLGRGDQQRAETFALAGALGSMAMALERAYWESGVEVREVIWELHDFIRQGRAPASKRLKATLQFCPWIEEVKAETPGGDRDPKRMLFQWIEIANERLTLRRYHRADENARHGDVLFGAPLRWLRADGNGAGEGAADAEAEALGEFTTLALRFVDLLEAEGLAVLGFNRIAPNKDLDPFSGSYAIAGAVDAPGADQIASAARAFAEDAARFESAGLGESLRPFAGSVAVGMFAATTHFIENGEWPASIAMPGPDKRQGAGFWRSVIKRISAS